MLYSQIKDRTHNELLNLFFKKEQELRRTDPALFWWLIDYLTETQNQGPGSTGLFYIFQVNTNEIYPRQRQHNGRRSKSI